MISISTIKAKIEELKKKINEEGSLEIISNWEKDIAEAERMNDILKLPEIVKFIEECDDKIRTVDSILTSAEIVDMTKEQIVNQYYKKIAYEDFKNKFLSQEQRMIALEKAIDENLKE